MKLYLLLAAANALKAPNRRSLLAATGAALAAPLTGQPAVAANDERALATVFTIVVVRETRTGGGEWR